MADRSAISHPGIDSAARMRKFSVSTDPLSGPRGTVLLDWHLETDRKVHHDVVDDATGASRRNRQQIVGRGVVERGESLGEGPDLIRLENETTDCE